MNALYQELAERFRGEVLDLARVVQRAQQAWPQARKASDVQRVYLDSVALNLHGFYSGLEGIFELVARHVDRVLPAGDRWHRDLLGQMTGDLPDVRPAVIAQDNGQALDEFRRFRHLVRNVYTINLVPDRIAGLMSALPVLWPKLQAELLAFCDFLDELARASNA